MASRVLLLLGLMCGLLSAASGHGNQCSAPCCPSGWTQFNSRCFFFHFKELNWIEAEQKCNSMNGNLASIHSLDENSFIKHFIERVTGFARVVWIGASDARNEGAWKWSDHSPFDYSRWNTGEPNNYYEEHCLVTHWNVDYWNDVDCYKKNSFVCTLNLNIPPPPPEPTIPPTAVYGY